MINTPVNPIAIANYFIRKGIDTGEEITLMKLIKLVYISHGWYLGLTGNALLPEAAEAWQYGPVVPKVYREFKEFGRGKITEMGMDFGEGFGYPIPENEELKTFLDKIWQVYGKYNGLQLSALTHQQGTPWYITWHNEGGKERHSVPIRDELIKEHYKNKITAANKLHVD